MRGLFVLFFFVLGCVGGKDKTNIELVQDMMDQESLKAQEWDEKRNAPSGLLPPENSIPRGPLNPYPYKGNLKEAIKKLRNPYKGNFSPEILALGKKYYQINCVVCHGEKGLGDGLVASKMILKPPSFVSDKILKEPDQNIYHTIMEGYGLMGSYKNQILTEKARWAVVNYVRSLQKRHKE